MARKYKSRVTTEKLDAKIEQQKEALEKAKARYEAEKDALAELVKMRNELRIKCQVFLYKKSYIIMYNYSDAWI